MKQVLITGFPTNIGKRTTIKFLNEGYIVYGVHSPKTAANAMQMKQLYPSIKVFEADFTIEESVSELIEKLRCFSFDVIVNNAGMLDLYPDDHIRHEFYDFDYKSFNDVMKCNFDAPLRLCIELKDRIIHGGSIVNIASGGGMRASYATISYSASKAALINLTASLSNNFYPYNKIRVNSISPGWVNPDDENGMAMDEDSPGMQAEKLTAMGRNASTSEIADVVFFLTTNQASFINGANIVVDGGWLNHNVIYYEEATGQRLLKP